MTHLFWLSNESWAAIDPHLPRGKPGKPRVDDRRVISGILHVLKTGCRWRDVLLAVVPDIGGELPVASNLLPHHEIFAGDFLRRRVFGLQAESPNLTRRRRSKPFNIKRGDFGIADLLRQAFPH
jgi:transposase